MFVSVAARRVRPCRREQQEPNFLTPFALDVRGPALREPEQPVVHRLQRSAALIVAGEATQLGVDGLRLRDAV
jgi:hypothetical protein